MKMRTAKLFQNGQSQAVRLGALDMMIGAHALSLGVTLATNNTREFSRIKGLNIVDWLADGKMTSGIKSP